MTTYFGKPAFHAYGNSNVKPAQGGLIYGDYMKTHNINPHSGDNHPDRVQIYACAMRGNQKSTIVKVVDGQTRKVSKSVQRTSRRERQPEAPRLGKRERPMSAKNIREQQERFPIMPERTSSSHNFPIQKPKMRPSKNIADDGTTKENQPPQLTNQQ